MRMTRWQLFEDASPAGACSPRLPRRAAQVADALLRATDGRPDFLQELGLRLAKPGTVAMPVVPKRALLAWVRGRAYLAAGGIQQALKVGVSARIRMDHHGPQAQGTMPLQA
jgi:hypothetical protein